MTTLDFSSMSYLQAKPAAGVRHLLAKVDGLHLDTDYSGSIAFGPVHARLRIEPGGWLRVQQPIDIPPRTAFRFGARLPGNVRFAATGGRMALIADAWLNGRAHLPRSLHEMGIGFRRAFDRSWRPIARDATIDPDQVEAVLARASWDDQTVVPLDVGWELRPTVAGEPRAVRLAVEGPVLRFHREVLPTCPRPSRAAIALQGLCLNSSFRHARLAWRDGAVVAETCLHDGQLEPCWLAHAARAVAVAARRARTTMEILAGRRDVARRMERTFMKGIRP